MPNHIKNRLVIKSGVEEVLEYLKNGDRLVDFNRITPMPICVPSEDICCLSEDWFEYIALKDLYKTVNRYGATGRAIKSVLIEPKGDPEQGMRMYEAYKQCGYSNWYKWNLANWDTKWNAYSISIKDNIVEFETAWSEPMVLMLKLSTVFSDVEFDYCFASEDCGSGTGKGVLLNGIFNCPEITDHSLEAYDIFFELNPKHKDDFKLVDGCWESKDDDED